MATHDTELEAVMRAWRLAPDGDKVGAPATDAELEEAERAMGRPLPVDLRRLYGVGNGLSVLGGNLQVMPLEGEGHGLVGHGDRLREWGWPIPSDLLPIGGNGGDELFGLWYPASAAVDGPTPVLMVGSVFEPACLAIVGTTLPRFLRAWSGYYLVSNDAPEAALDAIGLPEPLRTVDETRGLGPYLGWADPDLPDLEPDPYARGLDTDAVRALLG